MERLRFGKKLWESHASGQGRRPGDCCMQEDSELFQDGAVSQSLKGGEGKEKLAGVCVCVHK